MQLRKAVTVLLTVMLASWGSGALAASATDPGRPEKPKPVMAAAAQAMAGRQALIDRIMKKHQDMVRRAKERRQKQ